MGNSSLLRSPASTITSNHIGQPNLRIHAHNPRRTRASTLSSNATTASSTNDVDDVNDVNDTNAVSDANGSNDTGTAATTTDHDPEESPEALGTEAIESPVSVRLAKKHKLEPLYKLTKVTDSVEEVVREYLYGSNGGPAIRVLEQEHGAKWRGGAHHPVSKKYGRMKPIYEAVERGFDRKYTVAQIVSKLENERIYDRKGVLAKRSMTWLQNNIPHELR